jgi:hypothetical protein
VRVQSSNCMFYFYHYVTNPPNRLAFQLCIDDRYSITLTMFTASGHQNWHKPWHYTRNL